MHQLDLIMDFQYGSTGKGLIAGYLAKRGNYDTAVCSFAPNAGHTYLDKANNVSMMTQQLPTAGLICPSVKNIMIGPGAAIHIPTFLNEILKYGPFLKDKMIFVHPQAAIVEDYHAYMEITGGMTKIGSTAKGVGEAYIERIRRDPRNSNTAGVRGLDDPNFKRFVCSDNMYRNVLQDAQRVIVEGAQGYSLSMYHGQYPFTTSRDVTPWQIAADCGLPFKWASYLSPIGTLRCYPIRVNNRDGTSGPCYPDQYELSFGDLAVPVELTTVTKLARRIFTFSQLQLEEALWHCGHYYNTRLFLNFCNYFSEKMHLHDLVKAIESPKYLAMNKPRIEWLGFGPDDGNVVGRAEFDRTTSIQTGGTGK